jgi:hypothetical protein
MKISISNQVIRLLHNKHNTKTEEGEVIISNNTMDEAFWPVPATRIKTDPSSFLS